jgi:transposase
MDDDFWRPTHLTSEQMEERRLAAARLLRQGQLSQAEIARKLGVSRASVCRWAATLAQEGLHGLHARPIPGQLPRLDEKAWTRLGRLLDRGAIAAGFATERWTLERIAALIEREFGVHYHPRYLERPLKAHGFSVQRPATRATERNELVIAVWPKRDWVGLKKGAPGAADPGSLGRDRPQLPDPAGYDLGAARADLSAAEDEQTAGGLERGGDHAGQAVVCPSCPHLHLEPLCDPGPALCPPPDWHTAAGDLGSAQRAPLTGDNGLHRFARAGLCGGRSAPAYAPELNPEEQCNALVKRAMANALPGSVDDLHRLAHREFGRLKRHPEMIVRFFRHAGLSVTGIP